MASEIKVNTIKDLGGNTIVSSNGSGTFTSNLPSTTLTGSTNNQVTTVTGANAIVGEAGLIFDGSKLGIGTSTMTRTLNVTDTTASASTGIQLIGANDGTQFLNFGDTDDTNVGEINYDHSTNKMNFRTNDAYAMVIDSAGIVTTPLTTAFKVTQTGALSVADGHTLFSGNTTEVKDVNADFSNGTFTAPVDGFYYISCSVLYQDLGSGDTDNVEDTFIFSNGNEIISRAGKLNTALSSGGYMESAKATIAFMDANDTVIARHDDGGTLVVHVSSSASHFEGFLLG